MNKRAQIFLIASLIIVIILISVGATRIQAKANKEEKKVYLLAKEIKYEIAQGIDFSLTQNINSNLNSRIKLIIENYALSNPDKEILLLFGKIGNMQHLYYKKGENIPQGISITSQNDNIQLSGEFNNKFHLLEGYNIFVIVKKENGKEKTITVQ